MDRFDEMAKKVLKQVEMCGGALECPECVGAISAALRDVAHVPDGHVRVGVTDHKFPSTVDGVTVLPGMTMYFPSGVEAAVLAVWFDGTLDLQSHDDNGIPTNDWKRLRVEHWGYSTSAAAESARTARGEGKTP